MRVKRKAAAFVHIPSIATRYSWPVTTFGIGGAKIVARERLGRDPPHAMPAAALRAEGHYHIVIGAR